MRSWRTWLSSFLPVLGLMGVTACGGVSDAAPKARVEGLDYEISGPYSHENLEVYLVHGNDRITSDRKLMPLSEALEKKLAIVHETGNVNQLAIENTSDDVDVFVQSGDIVQGGKQDRTLATDLVVLPKSGKVPIASFCVEQGRWQARGGALALRFASSSNSVASADLKRAINVSNQQTAVWRNVDIMQKKLAASLGRDVRAAESASSLELTLDTEAVRASRKGYTDALAKLAEQADAIGFATVINGKINGADVYASHRLFARMWTKLLQAAAVEAVADKQDTPSNDAVTIADVRKFLAESDKGKSTERKPVEGINCVSFDNATNHYFETQIAGEAGKSVWLHRSYLSK